MDIKKNIIKAIDGAFAGVTDAETYMDINNMKKEIQKSGYKPQGRKSENKESTTTGASGASEPPLSGEMKEKWSEKYKKSINCNNPKGFSQRAHCQGRKKKLKENLSEAERTELAKLKELARMHSKDSKGGSEKERMEKMLSKIQSQFKKGTKVEMEHDMGITKAKQIALDHLRENPFYYDDLEKVEKKETKEATTSASSGQYSGPAFGAKSMSPKDWRGRAKTTYPGGAFVQVKKKCKNFPYCNQGDINALKLSRSPIVKKKAKKLAEQYGVSEELIMKIIIEDVRKNRKK